MVRGTQFRRKLEAGEHCRAGVGENRLSLAEATGKGEIFKDSTQEECDRQLAELRYKEINRKSLRDLAGGGCFQCCLTGRV